MTGSWCVYSCVKLRAAGIPFKVTERKHQVYWNVDEHYEVFVLEEFYAQGKAIAERGCFDFTDSDEDQKIMELQDDDTRLGMQANRNWRGRPEDATVEVWSEKTAERPWSEQAKEQAWMH